MGREMRSAAGAELPERSEGEVAERRVNPLGDAISIKQPALCRLFFDWFRQGGLRNPRFDSGPDCGPQVHKMGRAPSDAVASPKGGLRLQAGNPLGDAISIKQPALCRLFLIGFGKVDWV